MKAKSVLLVLLMIFSWNVASPEARSMNEMTRKFSESLAKGDANAVAAFYSKNAQLLPPNRDVVNGNASIVAFWKSAIDFGIRTREFQASDAFSVGDRTVEIGKYRLKDPKGKLIETGKYMMLWIKQDGTWKLHRDMWSSNTAEGCL